MFGVGGGRWFGGGLSSLLDLGDLDTLGELLCCVSYVELIDDAEDTVEVKMAGKTFQQKTRVRSQTSRRWRESRLSGRSWLFGGGEEESSWVILLSLLYHRLECLQRTENKLVNYIIFEYK